VRRRLCQRWVKKYAYPSVKDIPEGYIFNDLPVHKGGLNVVREKPQIGTFVYIVTYAEIKEGFLLSTEVMYGGAYPVSGASLISLHDGRVFQNGDSGAPVFAIREGRPYFVGQIESTYTDPTKRQFGIMINAPSSLLGTRP